uniref:Uncharacterized protein n=1 Tax=Branchiostoma floridae TaxID=7739 RepID=C3ZUJ5_BRAFL|eukprot:XP_002587696.1 hypothetical protein BRAFLDRAFT_94599 [Branchiostoma floridae]
MFNGYSGNYWMQRDFLAATAGIAGYARIGVTWAPYLVQEFVSCKLKAGSVNAVTLLTAMNDPAMLLLKTYQFVEILTLHSGTDSRLSNSVLNYLLTISIDGLHVNDFEFGGAVIKLARLRNRNHSRRHGTTPQGPRPNLTLLDHTPPGPRLTPPAASPECVSSAVGEALTALFETGTETQARQAPSGGRVPLGHPGRGVTIQAATANQLPWIDDGQRVRLIVQELFTTVELSQNNVYGSNGFGRLDQNRPTLSAQEHNNVPFGLKDSSVESKRQTLNFQRKARSYSNVEGKLHKNGKLVMIQEDFKDIMRVYHDAASHPGITVVKRKIPDNERHSLFFRREENGWSTRKKLWDVHHSGAFTEDQANLVDKWVIEEVDIPLQYEMVAIWKHVDQDPSSSQQPDTDTEDPSMKTAEYVERGSFGKVCKVNVPLVGEVASKSFEDNGRFDKDKTRKVIERTEHVKGTRGYNASTGTGSSRLPGLAGGYSRAISRQCDNSLALSWTLPAMKEMSWQFVFPARRLGYERRLAVFEERLLTTRGFTDMMDLAEEAMVGVRHER